MERYYSLHPGEDVRLRHLQSRVQIRGNVVGRLHSIPFVLTNYFLLQIETDMPDIPLYGEAFTYFEISKTPLVPVIIEGSATKISRGWGQIVDMNPKQLSQDPDNPEDTVKLLHCFCAALG